MNLTSAPLVNLLRQAECKIPITPEGSAMKTFIPQYNQLKNSIKRIKSGWFTIVSRDMR